MAVLFYRRFCPCRQYFVSSAMPQGLLFLGIIMFLYLHIHHQPQTKHGVSCRHSHCMHRTLLPCFLYVRPWHSPFHSLCLIIEYCFCESESLYTAISHVTLASCVCFLIVKCRLVGKTCFSYSQGHATFFRAMHTVPVCVDV